MHTTIIQPVINSHVISSVEGVALTEPVKIAKMRQLDTLYTGAKLNFIEDAKGFVAMEKH